MIIDTILTPAEIDVLPGRDLSDTACVVFDVLRATSSMVTALAHGATAIHPVATIEEALALEASMPAAVLGGERHGDPIPGFDVGNSPLEYRDLAGRSIITTTTNGTVALRACDRARTVIVGALLNLDAIVEHLRTSEPAHVLVVCAGTFREPALEDILAAGALIAALPGATLSDASQAAVSVYEQSQGDLLSVLRRARNGRALAARGRGAEVEWCSRRSIFQVVGVMQDRRIVAAGTIAASSRARHSSA